MNTWGETFSPHCCACEIQPKSYTNDVQILDETYVREYEDGKTIVIRDAIERDIDAITRIYNEAVVAGGSTADLTVRNLEQRREWVDSHHPRDKYPVVVIEVDGEVAGFGSLSKYHARAGYSEICEFSYYVDKAWSRHGLGTRLVAWLIDAAQRIGFRLAVCVVFAGNTGSTALMNAFGFTRYGYLPAACRNGEQVLDVAYWYRDLTDGKNARTAHDEATMGIRGSDKVQVDVRK